MMWSKLKRDHKLWYRIWITLSKDHQKFKIIFSKNSIIKFICSLSKCLKWKCLNTIWLKESLLDLISIVILFQLIYGHCLPWLLLNVYLQLLHLNSLIFFVHKSKIKTICILIFINPLSIFFKIGQIIYR